MCNAHSTASFSRSFSLSLRKMFPSHPICILWQMHDWERSVLTTVVSPSHTRSGFLWHQISRDVLLFQKPALTSPLAQSTVSASSVSPLLFCQHRSPLRTLLSTLRKWATTTAGSSTTHYKQHADFFQWEKTPDLYIVPTTYICTYSICLFHFPK